MEIKGVVFDLDGTLIDSHPITLSAFKAVLKKWGNVDLTDEAIYDSFGPPEKIIFRKYVEEENLENCYREYVKIFEENHTQIEVFGGIENVLSTLKRMGIAVGVFTGRGRELSLKILRFKRLSNYIEELVSSEDVQNPKPYPDGVEEICRRLGIKTSNCLHVGDSFMDIKSGKNAGVITAGALWGTRNRERLLKESPDFILNSPLDILEIIKNAQSKNSSS
ncbi:MAG: HAD family hydrolase [Candidatus Aminicenantia bacterium]